MQIHFKMLVINPGSTSTKISIFNNLELLFEKNISHPTEKTVHFTKIVDQLDFRKQLIVSILDDANVKLHELSAVVARGGLMQPLESGVYSIDEYMLHQLRSAKYGEHASNLGGLIAYEIATDLNIPCYIADPVVVDELSPIARLSGLPHIERKSIFHALNHKAVARRAAVAIGKKYEECRLVVAHLGGGISVAAHAYGRCIDVNNALGGEGPYTPERAGGLPVFSLTDLCFSGDYTKEEIYKLLVGKGGLTAYLGTNNGIEVEAMIQAGNEDAKRIFEGMAYQIAKEIGAIATVLRGDIDAIVLTGGLAHNKGLVQYIENMVKYISTVMVFPGEDEMLALAESGLRVLTKSEEAKILRRL